MGLRINSNVNALTALTNLRRTDAQLGKSLQRLSTGLRINQASDDPAGLVISEQFRAQIAGLEQAVENTQFASNLRGTAEAALQEVQEQLQEIRVAILAGANSGGLPAESIEVVLEREEGEADVVIASAKVQRNADGAFSVQGGETKTE